MRPLKTVNKWILLLATHATLVLGLTGMVVGTVAWYEYNARAGMQYYGTAVGFEGGLLVGLVSEIDIPDLVDKYDLIEEKWGSEYIYWSASGLNIEHMETYNKARGYGYDSIGACTSGAYTTGDPYKLKSAPFALDPATDREALKRSYCNYRLSFKEANYNGTRSDLYIEAMSLECERNIKDAVRIHFYDEHENKNFVFAPNYQNSGSHDVAGCLNLDTDEYYDHTYDEEFVYGEYDNLQYGEPYSEDIRVGTTPTTFDAVHKKGIKKAIFEPKKTEYLGYIDTVENKEALLAPSFELYRPILNMDIFIEGWDRAVIDSEIGSRFSLYITFGC